MCPWVTNWRACGRVRAHLHAEDHVVQPALQQFEQGRPGEIVGPLCQPEEAPELSLPQAVGALDLLLLAKLPAVVTLASAAERGIASMPSGGLIQATFQALSAIAEEVDALTPR